MANWAIYQLELGDVWAGQQMTIVSKDTYHERHMVQPQ